MFEAVLSETKQDSLAIQSRGIHCRCSHAEIRFTSTFWAFPYPYQSTDAILSYVSSGGLDKGPTAGRNNGYIVITLRDAQNAKHAANTFSFKVDLRGQTYRVLRMRCLLCTVPSINLMFVPFLLQVNTDQTRINFES